MSGGSLSGRVALVTGAAAGIGQEICAALAAEGTEIIGLDVASLEGTAEMVAAAGSELHAAEADLTDEDAATAAIDAAVASAGRLDVLINNAGIYPIKPIAESTLEDWRAVMSLNLDGTFVATRASLPYLERQEEARIINISSSTVWLGVPGMVAYTTSKMGLIGFTRALAAEVAANGITVNAITPGLLETRTALAGAVGEFFDYVVESQDVKRRMQPRDLTSTVLFLCDPGSAFITGQTVNVDGGMTKH